MFSCYLFRNTLCDQIINLIIFSDKTKYFLTEGLKSKVARLMVAAGLTKLFANNMNCWLILSIHNISWFYWWNNAMMYEIQNINISYCCFLAICKFYQSMIPLIPTSVIGNCPDSWSLIIACLLPDDTEANYIYFCLFHEWTRQEVIKFYWDHLRDHFSVTALSQPR